MRILSGIVTLTVILLQFTTCSVCLAWQTGTDIHINEKSKHYNDEHFKKAVVILGFFTAGQLKILADNENKKNFEVQPSKLL